MTLILADRQHPLRPRLEEAVQRMFAAEYGARVPSFTAYMIAKLDAEGAVEAAAGLRFEGDGFFSEAYIDAPVEAMIAKCYGQTAARREVVEFSSLAATRSGAALPLLQAAVRVALAGGARFAIFTATDRLRALLRRRGLTAIDLGPADPERVENAAAWGRYYLHDPHVLMVSAESLPKDCFAGWAADRRERVHHA